MRHFALKIFLVLLLAAVPMDALAQSTTWGDFSSVSTTGIPVTIALGGGSTVDVTVTTGGNQGLSTSDFGTVGSAETGLSYTNLTTLTVFNGPLSGEGTTILSFSNFVESPSHVRGLFMVSNVGEFSSPITLNSSVSGAVQGWAQVGNTFDVPIPPGDLGSANISWDASTGTLTTPGPGGDNSQGIVLDLNSLSIYGTITVELTQHHNDGINFSIGEEIAPAVPSLSITAYSLLLLTMLLAGVALSRTSA